MRGVESQPHTNVSVHVNALRSEATFRGELEPLQPNPAEREARKILQDLEIMRDIAESESGKMSPNFPGVILYPRAAKAYMKGLEDASRIIKDHLRGKRGSLEPENRFNPGGGE